MKIDIFLLQNWEKKWKDSESEKNVCESESGEEAACVTGVIGRMVKVFLILNGKTSKNSKRTKNESGKDCEEAVW